MICGVECHSENDVCKWLSVGIMNYSCDVISYPCGVTWNGPCRSHDDFYSDISEDGIEIQTDCVCTCLHDGGMRLIWCGGYYEIMVYGDVQVYLKEVSYVDNPSLCGHTHHTWNIKHWGNDVLYDLIPGTSDLPCET